MKKKHSETNTSANDFAVKVEKALVLLPFEKKAPRNQYNYRRFLLLIMLKKLWFYYAITVVVAAYVEKALVLLRFGKMHPETIPIIFVVSGNS